MKQSEINSLHAHSPQAGDLWLDCGAVRLFVVGRLTETTVVICDTPVQITNQVNGDVYWTWNVEEVKTIKVSEFVNLLKVKSTREERYWADVMPGKMKPFIASVKLDVWFDAYKRSLN